MSIFINVLLRDFADLINERGLADRNSDDTAFEGIDFDNTAADHQSFTTRTPIDPSESRCVLESESTARSENGLVNWIEVKPETSFFVKDILPTTSLHWLTFAANSAWGQTTSLSSTWTATSQADVLSVSSNAPQMLSNVFALHSKADAKHVIYLDFNGHKTSGTFWNDDYNNGKDFTTPSFTMDGSASFSAEEQEMILDVWRRVAEDFRPFNVDVTTAAPATHQLIKSSESDPRWGIRVVIGGTSTQWLGGSSGGIAYQDSFNFDSDTPTFVFSEQFTITDKNIAEVISHEVGHTLGLEHDGRTSPSEEYYDGHGSGDTGWAPIMGTGYYQTLTQWSKGEYTNASNSQDDLKVITTANGFSYRDDDHGSFLETSTLMVLSDNRFIASGIIERNTDVDYFTFGIQTSSDYQLNVLPYFRGPNLDIQAVVYNEAGKVLHAFNPTERLSVTEKLTLTVGKYHVRVRGIGKSGTDGYTNYGSLGTYYVRVIPKTAEIIVPTIQVYQNGIHSRKEEGTGSDNNFSFRLIRQGNLKIESRVSWRVTGVSADNSVDRFDFADDTFASGTAEFEFGNHQAFLSFAIKTDSIWERHERLQVIISNPINGTITKSSVVGTIYNDDSQGGGLASALSVPTENPLQQFATEDTLAQQLKTPTDDKPTILAGDFANPSTTTISLPDSIHPMPINPPLMLGDSNLPDFKPDFVCDVGVLVSG